MCNYSLEFMKKHFLFLVCLCLCVGAGAQVEVTPEDSALVVQLLQKAKAERGDEPRMMYFGKQFLGLPYVAHTLENGDREHLIVNLHGLDCTTFVETVAALSLCDSYDQRSFKDYCQWLGTLRYRHGKMTDYTSRLHYFTWWGEDNELLGLVCQVYDPEVFVETQTIDINYMTTFPQYYKHLKGNPSFIKKIREHELKSKGKRFRYIPKRLLNMPQTSALGVIHDGDIISMLTSKKGLDTQHIGIAFWQNGVLHLMHASSLYKKVVMDSTPFYDYEMKQPSHIGIRVYRGVKF